MRNFVEKITDFLVKKIVLLVVLISALGLMNPDSLTWVGPYVSILLGVAMFGMGMTLTVDDFKNVVRNPKAIFLGVLAQYVIMPMVALALVKVFALPPEIGIGVILLGACPGGTSSNVITYLAKGDVALSVSMSTVSTLLAPLVTPMITWLLADAVIDISLGAMMTSIFQMVVLPVILGLAIHHFFGSFSERVMPFMPAVSSVTIVLIIGGIVALSSGKLLEIGPMMAALVLLHNGFGLLLGYGLASVFHLDSRQARTVGIEVGVQNSGMAATLTVMYFNPAAAIPAAIYSVWNVVSGAIVANMFVKLDEKKGQPCLSENI